MLTDVESMVAIVSWVRIAVAVKFSGILHFYGLFIFHLPICQLFFNIFYFQYLTTHSMANRTYLDKGRWAVFPPSKTGIFHPIFLSGGSKGEILVHNTPIFCLAFGPFVWHSIYANRIREVCFGWFSVLV